MRTKEIVTGTWRSVLVVADVSVKRKEKGGRDLGYVCSFPLHVGSYNLRISGRGSVSEVRLRSLLA